MKKILAIVAIIVLLFLFVPNALADAGGPQCKNCLPTTVVINGDGTVTASTNATSQWCSQRSNGGGCNLRITNPDGHIWAFFTLGTPTTVNMTDIGIYCPCNAQFWEHGGQWHPYSALSQPFVP